MRQFWKITLTALFLAGCGMNSSSAMKTDVKELRSIIHIDAEISSARWEMFSTPESSEGGGPTDFVSLVAEVRPPLNLTAAPAGTAVLDSIFVVPGAARAWLSPASSAAISKMRNINVKPGDWPGCHRVEVKGAKSGRSLKAFACHQGDLSLIYVNLLP